MKRWLWILVFLLSVGLNIGWFSQYVVRQQRAADDQAIAAELDASVAELLESSAGDGGPQLAQPGRLPSTAGPGGQSGPMPRFLERMADALRLEGAQRDEFLGLQRQYFRHAWQQRRDLASLQHQVRRQVVSAEPDRQRIDALLQQMSELQYKMESQFVQHLLDSRQLLDGPRERRYLQLMARFRRMRASRWGEAPGRPSAVPRFEKPSER